MDIFKKPKVTRQDAYLLYSACAFSVFLWAFINIFYEMPSFLLKLTFTEIIGASAYYLAFALLESLLYFGGLFALLYLLAFLLPRRWFNDHFTSLGGFVSLLLAVIAMLSQTGPAWLTNISVRRSLFYLALAGLGVLVYVYAIFRFSKFDAAINAILKRLASLSMLYTFFGIASVLIVIIRNL